MKGRGKTRTLKRKESDPYLRFVVLRQHSDTAVQEGILQVAYQLRRSRDVTHYHKQTLDESLDWIETNLKTPSRFNRSKSKGHYRRRAAGVSWFKATALRHIEQMRAVAAVLLDNGYIVEQLATTRPGYVVYEDGNQVVAEPFRGEET